MKERNPIVFTWTDAYNGYPSADFDDRETNSLLLLLLYLVRYFMTALDLSKDVDNEEGDEQDETRSTERNFLNE